MERCEECRHCRVIRGSVRGIMDCDPDEWYCDRDNEMYFYCSEDEILSELKEDFILGKINEGLSREEAEALLEEEELDTGCPDFAYGDWYEEPDPDEAYDRMRAERWEE